MELDCLSFNVHLPTPTGGDLGDIAGVKCGMVRDCAMEVRLAPDVCLCGFTHTSGCIVNGRITTAAH